VGANYRVRRVTGHQTEIVEPREQPDKPQDRGGQLFGRSSP